MTKVFHCGELKQGCTTVIRGATNDDVVAQAKRHAEAEHGHTDHPADNRRPALAIREPDGESRQHSKLADAWRTVRMCPSAAADQR